MAPTPRPGNNASSGSSSKRAAHSSAPTSLPVLPTKCSLASEESISNRSNRKAASRRDSSVAMRHTTTRRSGRGLQSARRTSAQRVSSGADDRFSSASRGTTAFTEAAPGWHRVDCVGQHRL
ncbi:hypothetical protein Vretimale_5139 [Volvox reticuliferus]|uniref:Uncharacterized protein n=1 Tax=Volvox reticuliferus TaxID=1737510 RepID=A0A8J4G321_9CHLO|nr:hypothetical protein Vretifemale_4017 [Volvox reticuliferus]GIM00070.1 hypothetical protein Vretimale_5139 [Volvox reticuliferus]